MKTLRQLQDRNKHSKVMNYCPIFLRGCFIYIYTYYLLQYDVLQPSAKTWDFGSFFGRDIHGIWDNDAIPFGNLSVDGKCAMYV